METLAKTIMYLILEIECIYLLPTSLIVFVVCGFLYDCFFEKRA